MTSKNIITDVLKCLLRQKHAFKGFKFYSKNGPAFIIGQTDPDDLKKLNYGFAQVVTQVETCISMF